MALGLLFRVVEVEYESVHAREASAFHQPSAGEMRTEILNVCGTCGSAVFSPTVFLCCTSRRSIRLAESGYSALARRDRWTDDGCEDPYRCGLKC